MQAHPYLNFDGNAEEADRLFAALSAGGKMEMPMGDQPRGDYWGSFRDKYGTQWMINYHKTADEEE